MTARKLDLSVGMAAAVAGLLTLFYLIPNFTDAGMGFGLSPHTFPNLCAGAITVLGLALVGLSLRAAAGDTPSPIKAPMLKRLVLVLVVLLLALALMEWVGFLASGLVMVALLMWIMGERRWIPLIATPLVWTLFLWVLFDKILATPLP